jgi:hypothetical protein
MIRHAGVLAVIFLAVALLCFACTVVLTFLYGGGGTLNALLRDLGFFFGILFCVGWLALAITHRDRAGDTHCKKCGYDLTGNTSGVCPECGTQAGF